MLLNLISNGFYAVTERKAAMELRISSRRLPRPRARATIVSKSASATMALAFHPR